MVKEQKNGDYILGAMPNNSYNPLRRWLRRKGMSQYLDREYFGYRVKLRPTDQFRRVLRLPFWHLEFLPYFCGSDITFNLCIKPTKRAIPNAILNFNWVLHEKGVDKPRLYDDGMADMSANKVHKDSLSLGHFPFTGDYQLDMVVTNNGGSICQSVANFEITSRANMQMAIIWFMLAALFALITFLLGLFVGK